MTKKLSTKEFIQKAKIKHNDKYDYSKVIYINSKTKIEIICSIHGSFYQKPNNHLNGQGCPKCKNESLKLTIKEFIEKAKILHNNKYDYSRVNYIDSKTNIEIICPIHGSFYQKPNDHLKCKGCLLCKGNKIATTVQNKNEIKIKNKLNEYGYTLLEKYCGIENKEYRNKPNIPAYHQYKIKHKCGHIFYDDLFRIPKCPKCFPHNKSQLEEFYFNMINNITNNRIERNVKYFKDQFNNIMELDIYLPDQKIAFEINGIYFHSVGHLNGVTNKNYHQNKTDSCWNLHGIKLYHIWEHYDQNIIRSMINNILDLCETKYMARKLRFQEITNKDNKEFLDINHLHGSVNSILNFGLFDDNELISTISYRKLKNNNIEIARFCNKLDILVIGGFSKLLKNSLPYLKDYDKIITYADKDWSPTWKNTVYHISGFNFIKDSGPSMSYTKSDKVYSRQTFQKYKLKSMFPDIYDDNLTEQQILSLKNIYPIYNSGNWKFEMVIKNG